MTVFVLNDGAAGELWTKSGPAPTFSSGSDPEVAGVDVALFAAELLSGGDWFLP